MMSCCKHPSLCLGLGDLGIWGFGARLGSASQEWDPLVVSSASRVSGWVNSRMAILSRQMTRRTSRGSFCEVSLSLRRTD